MKRFTLILSLLVAMVTTAMAQKAHQRVSHDGWVVTALNEAGTTGNEGGVAFIADDNASTFYHSNWSSNYTDGTGANKGKDGLQAFMVELPTSLSDLSLITYKGRSDNNTSGWARGVRVYVFETLPTGWPAGGLSSLGYEDKQALLASTNTNLGTAAFDNTAKLWANDRTQKLVEFATPQTGKYVLFIMESGSDAWLTCSDFQIYQLKDYAAIEAETPYFLQVTNAAATGTQYVDIKTPFSSTSANTIGISTTTVEAYFEWNTTANAWNIKDDAGKYLAVSKWDANPDQATAGNWQLFVNDDNTLSIFQGDYDGGSDNSRCFLGGDVTTDASVTKLYTDNAKDKAINVTLIDANAVPVTVKYSFTWNGVEKGEQTTETFGGELYPDLDFELPFGVAATKPDGEIDATEAEEVEGVKTIKKTIVLENTLPFAFADSYANINNWYYLKFHSDNGYYLHHDEDQNYIDLGSKAIDNNNKDAYTWAFIGNPFDGYKIVNRAKGDGYILSSSTTMAGNTGSDTWPIMTEEASLPEGNNTYWIPTSSSHHTNGFFLAQKDYPANRMNDRGKLAYWTVGAGSGSTFWVEERPMGPVAELEALIATAETLKTTVTDNQGTAIGKYSAETLTALAAAIDDASAIEEANVTEEDVATLQAAIDAVSVILPTAGKYYQFHSSLAAFAETKAIHGTDGNPGWKTLNNDDKNFYWKAVETGNGIALQNAANGKYLHGNADQSGAWSLTDSFEGAEMGVKIFSEAENEKGFEYGIILNNWQMHADGHGGGAYASGNLVSWNTDNANSASSWYIVEVELKEFFTVTYNFKYNGEIKYTHSVELAKGAAFPTVNVALPYGVTTDFAVPDGTVETDATFNFNLNVEAALPFETAASANDITTWYLVRMHTSYPGYIGDIADDNTINVYTSKSSDVANENFIWGFVGDVFNGITVVNKGTGKKLTSTGSGNVTLTDDGTPFFVARTTETTDNATNGFCLRKFDSNNYLNANYSAGKLSHWASTDAGSTFFLTEYEETEVTVGDANWATMYLGYSVYVPEGVNAYTISGVENGYVTKVPVEGVIPANTGVLLENAGTFTFKKAAKDVAAIAGNLMNGSVENTYVEGKAYVLANHEEEGLGFYVAELNKDGEGNDGETHFLNNAGKAYLVLPAASETVAFYGLDWDGTTGIDEITDNRVQSTVIYDLTGRRVETITEPGIYIVGGKKVLVK